MLWEELLILKIAVELGVAKTLQDLKKNQPLTRRSVYID